MKKMKAVKAWAYYQDGKIQKCQNGVGTTLCIHTPQPRLNSGEIVKEFVQVIITPIKKGK